MDKQTYRTIRAYMAEMMKDSAHDCLHVYRVLYQAMRIAKNYEQADRDVLIASCLLHDIGRQAQFDDPGLCHAVEGGKMAYAFLRSLGWEESRCRLVKDCITTHRYRTDAPPQTIEAKILFDADKLDATGALGVARTLIYAGHTGTPLYTVDENGTVLNEAAPGGRGSFLHEYNFKLRKLYDLFFTKEAYEIAQGRKKLMTDFYEELLEEITFSDMESLLEL